MKTIGLLGGTGWSSTINYYILLNELVNERLGGYHSAKILLKSVDYHEIMSNYGKDHSKVANALKQELQDLIALNPDCLMICCNSLHKYYDMIKDDLNAPMPVFHAIGLVAEHALQKNYRHVLLLATTFTMEDGFFSDIFEKKGIHVTIPTPDERAEMQKIHDQLMQNVVTPASCAYFSDLIAAHKDLDAVVLGCTEYHLVVDASTSALPIMNPVHLQVRAAVEYALAK